ncbi:MAG: thioredoxin-disulfide reductase [Anaerolineae bacterium]|nr:thioredoxin-disulfide reductase [Anaerolineae bacterium]MDK1081798.1 thioredoxin-disulfide reductase [Anaerolineae bacterium]MDK1118935.1 thioredoxin-disulfide reductase [Anaerolineae bacterium]
MFNLGSADSLTKTKDEKGKHVKLLVLGSGPAGYAAALYAARAELEPVVLTGMQLGGQAALTFTIENYPGFPKGVGGPELGELFQKQAENFGATTEFDVASSVDFSKKPLEVTTDNRKYLADSVIITTGANPNPLDIPGEKELVGRGVSYCATCDGWFFKDKKVVVVGGGDSALEEALFITRYASEITIIHRRDELRAGAILQNRALEHEKIKFIWDTVLTEVVGEEKVESVKLKNVKSNEVSTLEADGVFIFIGHTPNTSIFEDQLEKDELGYLIVNHMMETNVPGVFAAGEVADPHFRQVVTSAGMGSAAAIQATRYLEAQEA